MVYTILSNTAMELENWHYYKECIFVGKAANPYMEALDSTKRNRVSYWLKNKNKLQKQVFYRNTHTEKLKMKGRKKT